LLRVYLPSGWVSELEKEEKEEEEKRKEGDWGEVPAWLYHECNIF